MPQVELIGLIATALLVGALLGGFFTARSARATRRAAHEQQCIEALVGWLAARRAWREKSAAMVRAVRALAQEPRHSPKFDQRCASARAAKRRFRAVHEKLTFAQAAMETWRGDALGRLSEPPRQPAYAQIKRAALRGGANRLEILRRRLDLADKADLEWVRNERIAMRARRSVFAHFGVWAQRIVWRVVRAWDRPR